ncbi:MAG TPA: biotin/lipoyl-containing protein [Ktedonobacteraceae bacterium]|nr:biotin/lipoyl-containing protein [Ktedonobacteraceae bacterium]
MDGSKPSQEEHHRAAQHGRLSNTENGLTSLDQLRHLVHLLDQSDVSELELKQPGEGTRLILRKITAPSGSGMFMSGTALASPAQDGEQLSAAAPEETRSFVSAHLVGIFHHWARPKGGILVAVGNHVKVGQLVATIESLDIINEVESPIAGKVVEILVQEGQPVEYGQHLLALEPVGNEEEA